MSQPFGAFLDIYRLVETDAVVIEADFPGYQHVRLAFSSSLLRYAKVGVEGVEGAIVNQFEEVVRDGTVEGERRWKALAALLPPFLGEHRERFVRTAG